MLAIKENDATVKTVAFSPDGKRLAVGGGYKNVLLYQAITGKELAMFPPLPPGKRLSEVDYNVITSLAFSPDGKQLATGSSGNYNDSGLDIWDTSTSTSTGKHLCHINKTPWYRKDVQEFQGACHVAFSPDGKRCAVNSFNTVEIWDTSTYKNLLTIKDDKSDFVCLAFSPDGKKIVTSSEDRTVKIWNAFTGHNLLTLKGHDDIVYSVVFSPDGKMLASGGKDKTINIWDISAKEERSIMLNGQTGDVCIAAFSIDGKRIATSGEDGTLKIWDVQTSQELYSIYNELSANKLLNMHPRNQQIYSLAFSPQENQIALVRDRQVINKGGNNYVENYTLKILDLSLARNNPWFDRDIKYFTGSATIAYSPNGKMIVSGDGAGICDASTGKELLSPIDVEGPRENITRVAFSPDAKRIVACYDNDKIGIWNALTGKKLLSFKNPASVIVSAIYSPDGKQIVSSNKDNTLIIWDSTTGEKMFTLRGHTDAVCSFTFSPDGKRIVSAGKDNMIIIWDINTGQSLLKIKGCESEDSIIGVTFSSDGNQIIIVTRSGKVKTFDGSPQ